MNVGYPCVCLGLEGVNCRRTTVLRNAGPERLRSLIRGNIESLQTILEYNDRLGIHLFRIGTEFVPFGSHPINQIRWWEEMEPELCGVGAWVRSRGHRLSFHSSPYTILNSIRPVVVDNAILELEYYGRVFEAMGLGEDNLIILHMGTAAPNMVEAEDRLALALDRVPERARKHLALENDDRVYSVDRAVRMGNRTGLPVVFDDFHHRVNPGAWRERPVAEILEEVLATWKPGRTPKIHYSSQDPDKRPGAHASSISPIELAGFLEATAHVPRDFDIMFESKGKDLSVLEVLGVLGSDRRFNPALAAA